MASPAKTTLRITSVRNEPGRTTTLGRPGVAGVEEGLELASRLCCITEATLSRDDRGDRDGRRCAKNTQRRLGSDASLIKYPFRGFGEWSLNGESVLS
jgi:hypothetical protein